MADRVGQYIDDYHLVRCLGTGSFGEVYLGEQVHDHSQVAVKLLLLKQEDLQGGLEGFIKEAGTAFRLKHPHIVQVLSFGITSDHAPYLIMKYASNGTLRERHPKGTRLSLETVVSYLLPLASALQYAHDKRVVHRDVKPENVLLGPAGEVWLSDFGIAVTAPIERSFITQGLGGTLPYMAPEQLSGGKPQPASDQYALGIMMYEWLCGVRPFQGNQLEIVGQHISRPPPPLREKRPDLSSQVEEIVLRTLAKDPHDRFARVQDFATALAQTNQVASQTDRATLPTTPLPEPPGSPGVIASPASDQVAQPKSLQQQASLPAPTPLLQNLTIPVPAPARSIETDPSLTAPSPSLETDIPSALPAGSPLPTQGKPLISSSSLPPSSPSIPPLPLPPSPIVPTLPIVPPHHPKSPRHKHLIGKALTVCILLLLLVGGSLVGVRLSGSGPLAGSGTKASPTSTHQATPTATATSLPIGNITDFPLPTSSGPPEGITIGPDGNLWFLEGDANRVGRITPRGTLTEFSVPSAPGGYTGTGAIITGPDGNLWFTESLSKKIGRITPTGKITEFSLPINAYPEVITVGPDRNLWFTMGLSVGIIGRLTPDGQFIDFRVNNILGGGITAGPDGNLWFTDEHGVGKITPHGTITEFPVPTGSMVFGAAITVGPDGNLWFTDEHGVGRITPTGKITEFPVPIASNGFTLPETGITTGPDGNLWFTERGVNQIGRITPTGKITEFPAPNAGADGPQDITVGPDGNLWFTESDKIGRITTGR
jgi:serine/threonine protein kinase